jgi:trimeric autotransporter adhesin
VCAASCPSRSRRDEHVPTSSAPSDGCIPTAIMEATPARRERMGGAAEAAAEEEAVAGAAATATEAVEVAAVVAAAVEVSCLAATATAAAVTAAGAAKASCRVPATASAPRPPPPSSSSESAAAAVAADPARMTVKGEQCRPEGGRLCAAGGLNLNAAQRPPLAHAHARSGGRQRSSAAGRGTRF